MSKLPGIYVMTDVTDGKAYVGSTVDLKTRTKEHLRKLERNTHTNWQLQRAFNKGNDLRMLPLPLKEVDSNKIREIEQTLIDEFKNTGLLYNIATEVGVPKNASSEPVVRAKMSESHKRFWSNPDNRKQQSERLTGIVRSNEFKESVSRGIAESGYKRPKTEKPLPTKSHTPEAIRRCYEASIAKDPPKPVMVNGTEYPSIKEAARQTGIPKSTLLYRINSGSAHCGDYIFL